MFTPSYFIDESKTLDIPILMYAHYTFRAEGGLYMGVWGFLWSKV